MRCATSTQSIPAFRLSQCVASPFLSHGPRPSRRSSQPGKQAIDLIIDFLASLWDYAKQQITREIGAVADLGACTTCGARAR